MKFYSDHFPREIGKYRQGRVNNLGELIDWVNKWNGKVDLYTSLYGYANWNGSVRPDYSSAIIDRIYWDLDPEDKRTDTVLDDPAERALRLSDALIDDGVGYWLVMSGNGLNVYADTDSYPLAPDRKKAVIHTIQTYYDQKAGEIQTDAVKGDIARISRIIGTRNLKFRGEEKRFCVFVSREDVESGNHIERSRANQNNNKAYIKGTKPIDLFYWEENSPEFIDSGGINFYEEGIEEDAEIDTDWYCILKSLERVKKSQRNGINGTNRDRFLILSYLCNTGYTAPEALGICKKEFHESVFRTMRNEGQLKNIFMNGIAFPSRATLGSEGRCNNCGMC